MSADAHGLLSRISEQKRDKEADVLQQLTGYRLKLVGIIQLSDHESKLLQKQHETMLAQGTQAMDIIMLNQSIAELQQRVLEVRFEMGELDKAIAQQRQKWAIHHKKHVAHEKMHDIASVKQKRLAEQRQQTVQDNQFSATMVAKRMKG